MTIAREPLRQAVRRALFRRVVNRELDSGTPINELELADELGVSRTPLREALIALECEGIVGSTPGKGFHVVPLEVETARDLYELAADLETLALRRSEPLPPEHLDELQKLNERRRRSLVDPERLVELDTEWHHLLLSGCTNQQLLRVLALVKTQLYRYEYAYMKSEDRVLEATDDHSTIIDALRTDRREQAADVLARHWERGLEQAVEGLATDGAAPQSSEKSASRSPSRKSAPGAK